MFISTENMLQDFAGIERYNDNTSEVIGTPFSENDILIANIRPYLKKVWKAEFCGACSSDVLALHSNSPATSDFLYHIIARDSFISYVMSGAKGSKMPRGDKAHILDYDTYIPSEAEQKKISKIMDTINIRIEKQRQLVEALKSYKRGALSKLFPQSGEDAPEYRFAGFTEPWAKRQFGEVFYERREKTKAENEDILLSCAIDGMYLNSELFDHFRGQTTVGYLKVKKFDLILSAQNLHLGNANVNLRFEHGIISPAYKVFDIVECDPNFIQAWVKKEDTKNFFLTATTEGASQCRKNIEWATLFKQTIPMPSIGEQRTIGIFAHKLDMLIEDQKAKLDECLRQKRGLLQNLFI